MYLAKTLLGGLVKVVSNIDPADFMPSDPPPPRRPLNFAQANESEEEKRFRNVFQQLAGDDMEVSPNELMNILNKVVCKHGNLKTDGFSIESCRSMVAVMDCDSTGKLGFDEFKYLWNNIKRWQDDIRQLKLDLLKKDELIVDFSSVATTQPKHLASLPVSCCGDISSCPSTRCSALLQGVYIKHDSDRSGAISSNELPNAFKDAGFPLNDDLFKLIIRRYSDENGDMDFDNFIGCLVRLDCMCRAFKTLDKGNSGNIELDVKEWLQLTMYS